MPPSPVTPRLLLLILAIGFTLEATDSLAQQTKGIPTVGIIALAATPDDPIISALRQRLNDLGYIEGRTINFEFRTAQGHPDRLPKLSEELVRLKVDVIVVGNALVAQSLQRVTSTTPIVMATSDPVASGLVSNLARPDGNITGLSGM